MTPDETPPRGEGPPRDEEPARDEEPRQDDDGAEADHGDTGDYTVDDAFLEDLDETLGEIEAESGAASHEGKGGDEHEAASGEVGTGAETDSGEGGDGEVGENEVESLEEVVSAETEEWPAPEPSTGEETEGDGTEAAEVTEPGETVAEPDEEPTVVDKGERAGATAVAADAGGPGFMDRFVWGLGAPLRWIGDFRPRKLLPGYIWRAIRRIRFPLWARFMTASFLIVASMAGATAVSGLLYLNDIASALDPDHKFDKLTNKLTQVDGGAPQTILIIGSDKRAATAANPTPGFSDTALLLRLDPDRDAIALFSIPRDLKVTLPGGGIGRFNEAFTKGGAEATLQTVQTVTGLDINHVVNVDFLGFAKAVNAIDCVFVDVDRRYFNEGGDYAAINIQPGYQKLCGVNALAYVRYRHEDNDVVRAARQQDFLREARAKVPASRLFTDRKELIKIFTDYTTSDINDAGTMLQVLKLFIEARDAPVKEVHFEGTIGPSFVTATPAEIQKAVREFLGIQDTPGKRAKDALPPSGAAPIAGEGEKPPKGAPAPKKSKEPKGDEGAAAAAGLESAVPFAKELAEGIAKKQIKLPIYYPSQFAAGSIFAEKPRVYRIDSKQVPKSERISYKWVMKTPELGEYYGLMGTRWKDPPILRGPSERREIGDREYELFYDGDRLRLAAWQTDEGSFWVSNSLPQSLTEEEMLGIARNVRELGAG